MKRGDIAVVVPVFNGEATLAHCLSSVMGQTSRPDEIVVVDDGSSDRSAAIARSFGSRVVVLTQENQGSAAARQAGTEAASAEYVAYLDADDWWPSDRVEGCRKTLASTEVTFMMSDFRRACPGDSPSDYRKRNTEHFPWFRAFLRRFATRTSIPGLFRFPQPHALRLILRGFPYFPSASVVRRDDVLGAGGWDPRFRRCQDFDLALRITRRFPLHYRDEVEAIVGLHEGNQDPLPYVVQQTMGDIQVLKSHFRRAETGSDYRKKVGKALARKYCALGYAHRRAGDHASAAWAYRRALRWPGHRLHSGTRLLISGLVTPLQKLRATHRGELSRVDRGSA